MQDAEADVGLRIKQIRRQRDQHSPAQHHQTPLDMASTNAGADSGNEREQDRRQFADVKPKAALIAYRHIPVIVRVEHEMERRHQTDGDSAKKIDLPDAG